ncbi:MAG: anti-sigma factor, partial [Pseudomonadota bacterium]
LESTQSDFSFQAEIRGRELAVFTTGAGAPEGRALEVWLIEGDADPVSLGLIGGALSLGDLTFNTGTVLAVSIEPPGGSPSGTPTGQVVALGDLRNVLG